MLFVVSVCFRRMCCAPNDPSGAFIGCFVTHCVGVFRYRFFDESLVKAIAAAQNHRKIILLLLFRLRRVPADLL